MDPLDSHFLQLMNVYTNFFNSAAKIRNSSYIQGYLEMLKITEEFLRENACFKNVQIGGLTSLLDRKIEENKRKTFEKQELSMFNEKNLNNKKIVEERLHSEDGQIERKIYNIIQDDELQWNGRESEQNKRIINGQRIDREIMRDSGLDEEFERNPGDLEKERRNVVENEKKFSLRGFRIKDNKKRMKEEEGCEVGEGRALRKVKEF
jgi:hypothetical protein